MSEILRSPITGNAIWLTARSGSHSLAIAALSFFWPHVRITSDRHPACFFEINEYYRGDNQSVGLVVRNPIERFCSLVAHRPERTLEQHLAEPLYVPLPKGEFVRYFRFEDQLNEAAAWLDLPTPLPHEDATDEADKPILTPEQEARVREIYAADIALWESLHQ